MAQSRVPLKYKPNALSEHDGMTDYQTSTWPGVEVFHPSLDDTDLVGTGKGGIEHVACRSR